MFIFINQLFVPIILVLFCSHSHKLPGDNSYCHMFRKLNSYRKPRDFGDLLDATVLSYITDHWDQKITVIRERSVSLSVMFDLGYA